MKKSLVLLILALNADADVVSSGPAGFEISIERSAMVNAKTAYEQFLRVGEWWHPDHTWFGNARGLYIEPSVGGCFCEKSAEKQALHMTVSYVDPGKEIRMVGGLIANLPAI